MATKTNAEIIREGLWTNNPALVQVLGLCPLLAVTSTVVNAIGLGLATLLVLMGSNLAVSLIRHFVSESVRLPAFVMIIASFVTCAELLMQAFTYELYQILGIFIPLIVTNCAILGRADAFASKNGPIPALLDGIMMGLGFLAVLVVLGGLRELIGQGTLFTDMDLLLGPVAADWGFRPLDSYPDVLFMVLPPGAFVGLGLLIALKNSIDNRAEKRRKARVAEPVVSGSKRVRVTGQVS
ncbi:electron transport complex subunit E [Marinobacter goseongensis]|jgi:electron transport complex protein RnfE|uniref:electron transport complex subunit E n=1 Tax=Marinobacter goseongensis TaxID=453838 RepID=UPI002003681E|nr:electron transport complex subunit E [Marinobacter goseongensis]MCK7552396.1 electron transport complex subunit E [Marinobacter goseongensis]